MAMTLASTRQDARSNVGSGVQTFAAGFQAFQDSTSQGGRGLRGVAKHADHFSSSGRRAKAAARLLADFRRMAFYFRLRKSSLELW